ncbi:MAG: ribonuclease HII, partial [Nanoarchaeota archaeon]|nr:ribonuclease HII [Nanoarchaeota archaeon]MBU1596950.1 ribonuclease HII [Nanoarchaeota archaeon]
MIIAGVEEAGRGPVIGPLVIAIAAVKEEDEFKLKAMGAKDSKLLTPLQRERLYDAIIDLCEYEIIVVSPEEVDAAVMSEETNLNWLEADKTAILINKLKPDKVYLDCPSTNLDAYKNYIQKKLNYKPELIVEHKADVNYTIVGTASILAKVTRDSEVRKLKAEFGVDFGSGYPSDPLTMAFTSKNFNKYPFFRKSWETWQKAKKQAPQKK